MRIKLYLLLLLLLASMSVFPIPANQNPIIVEQEDGTYITIFLRGDEKLHYFITEDGIPVIQEKTNRYCYAMSEDCTLISSGIIAHNSKSRSDVEHKFILSNKDKAIRTIENIANTYLENKEYDNVKLQRTKRNVSLGQQKNYIGEKKGLVILVGFDDLEMSIEEPNKAFDMAFNEKGYNKNNHIGSVSDYFYDQSYGKFKLSFDVVGPVKISKNFAYYGANSSWNSRTDMHVGQFVTEACKLVDDFVDYSKYDWDGDGNVEQIFIVYAGYGESSGAPSYTIWPHKGDLYSLGCVGDGEGILQMDGVNINDYACTCELSGISGRNMNGIGTACHEFSHCLGLPDFYNVNYTGGFGMSSWDLMDSGGHNGPTGNGEVPCGYSAYERWFAGWLSFVELCEMTRVKDMECIEDAPVAYKISNDNNPNEYFMLENRQNRGWFSYVGTSNSCHGMLITHVDYLPPSWAINSVNTIPSHQRMSVVPADNDYGHFYDVTSQKRYVPTNEDLEGDVFPGSRNIREFTNKSHYNVGGRLYNENVDGSYDLNKPITNIKEYSGLISFDFMGGLYVEKPSLYEPKAIDKHGFEISWTPVSDAYTYILEATEIRDKMAFESLLLSENFQSFKTDEGSSDGLIDLSTYLDSYTRTSGWVGKNIYTSIYGAKIGKNNAKGYLQTPLFTIQTNSVTLSLSMLSNEQSCVNLILLNQNKDTLVMKKIQCENGQNNIHLNFDMLESSECCIDVNVDGICYITSMSVYDGSFTTKEISGGAIIGSLLRPLDYHIIEGIKKSSYTFLELKSSKYKVRVRAEKDEALSEWSDYVIVNCDDANIINHTINSAPQTSIYSIKGQKVDNIKFSGFYIVNDGINNKKIMIK